MYNFIFIIIAAMMWAIDGVLLTPNYFVKGFYDVKFIVFISHFTSLIFLCIFHSNQLKKLKEFNKDDYLYFLLISLFGGTIGTLSIVKALQLSNFSLSMVTLIQKSQPIFAVIMAYILLREKPTKKFYIIFTIAIISLYFLIFGLENPKLLNENNLKAAMYSLIAAICFGSSTVFGRKVSINHSFLTTTFYRFFFTSIIAFIILLLFGNFSSSLSIYINIPNLYILTIVIAIFGLVAILLYYKGMMSTNAIYATLCELAYPLTSVILEAIIYKRVLSTVQLISAVVLISSILYMNLQKINDKIKK